MVLSKSQGSFEGSSKEVSLLFPKELKRKVVSIFVSVNLFIKIKLHFLKVLTCPSKKIRVTKYPY